MVTKLFEVSTARSKPEYRPLLTRTRKSEEKEQYLSNIIAVTSPSKISRDKYNNVLPNKEENNQYRVVYDKRVILYNYNMLPTVIR